MKSIGKGRSFNSMSAVEMAVFDALKQLDAQYRIVQEPPPIEVEPGRLYRPDFLISDDVGRHLVVEVKSAAAISLPGLIRLSKIDEAIKAKPRWRFLVVVFGSDTERVGLGLSEFEDLRVSCVQRPGEILQIVKNELAGMT